MFVLILSMVPCPKNNCFDDILTWQQESKPCPKIYIEKNILFTKKIFAKPWKLIRSVIPNKPNRQPPHSIMVHNSLIENNETISNHFNNYFCTIGSNLAEKIETTSTKPSSFLEWSILDSIYLDPPHSTEFLT